MLSLFAGCASGPPPAYKPPSTTFKTEVTKVPIETKKWVDTNLTNREFGVVQLEVNYDNIRRPALEGKAILIETAPSYTEFFYREKKKYHYVGRECVKSRKNRIPYSECKNNAAGRLVCNTRWRESHSCVKSKDVNKITEKTHANILSDKTKKIVVTGRYSVSKANLLVSIMAGNTHTKSVNTTSDGRFSVPLTESTRREITGRDTLDVEFIYDGSHHKVPLNISSFSEAYKKYEERISVAFSEAAPAFSSWQQALPYSGASSGKALIDIKNRYEATATAYLQLADKQTQIPKVPQPELPPQIALEQGKYESDRTFEERVQAAIDERNDKIVQLQERYQQQVAERNARIDALNQLQRQRQAQLEDNKIEFMADAMRAELVDFKVRNASFDQATALLYFDLYSTNSDYQELIAIETHDPVITERLAENPEQIQPELTFRIEGDGFSLQQVTLKSGAVSEVAQVMAAKNVTSRGQQRVVIDSSKLEAASGIAAVAGLQKQNPNIVDRFRTGVITYNNGKTEQRDTGLDNDELWLAVQELRNSRLNDNAFLFVIGIEDYKSAAPVPYAENSALVTKELLRVKAGVPDKNVYLLTQDKTTGTQIRGELSKMLGRLDSDSLVYFYYAGHGVPDISSNESVYLLPADAVQGAYQDDNFKLDNIMRQIAARQPQHAYFFLDTCFSGRVNRNELLFPGVGALMVETIKPKVPENVTVFYGGQGTQFANAFEDKRHRLMSYYLAKGVLGGKDSIAELSDYLNREVRKESLVKGGDFRQEPFIDGATEGRLFRTAAAR